MPSAVRLREDYSAKELRALARRSQDVNQSRRLLSLAAVRDGMDRGGAAKMQLHLDEIVQRRPGGACRPAARSRRMAYHRQARHARQHHADLPAFAGPGVEPGRERLAISPSELALKHRLRKLRRHRRRRLQRVAVIALNPKPSRPSECAAGLTSVTRYDRWYHSQKNRLPRPGVRST